MKNFYKSNFHAQNSLILGATGLVGGKLLEMLLQDEQFSTIKIFGRSGCGITHLNIEEHLGDLFDLEQFAGDFTGDVVFCCIGTTKAKTPDKETYRKIDYGIPVNATKLAKQNGIKSFQVISAMGANPDSSTFYNKTKGDMERDVLEQGISNTYIFQPSLIGGDRDEKRFGERLAQIVMGALSFLIPKKYQMIEPETIAKAMVLVSKKGYGKQQIPSDEIKEIANG